MEREIFDVPEEEMGDFTKDSGNWVIDKKVYDFVETNITSGDGEWFDVIVKRRKDGKFFTFSWGQNRGNYNYVPTWKEVIPRVISKTIYEWPENE